MPSFTGLEPEISERGRTREARAILAAMRMPLSSDDDHEDDSDAAGARFIDELERIADRAKAGAVLARLLDAPITVR